MINHFLEPDTSANDLSFNLEAYVKITSRWPNRCICPYCGKEGELRKEGVQPRCRNESCQGKKIWSGKVKRLKQISQKANAVNKQSIIKNDQV